MSRPRQDQQTVAPDGKPAAEQPDWRREFPIDASGDADVARRDFTQMLVLTSLASIVIFEYCVIC